LKKRTQLGNGTATTGLTQSRKDAKDGGFGKGKIGFFSS
jgi:hypothetical protein